MRSRVRDRQDVYIALRLPPVTLVDDNGYECGTVVQYDTPVKYRLRVLDVDSESEISLYGAKTLKMKKIVESPVCLPSTAVSYLAAVWIDKIPGDLAYADPIETETTTTIPYNIDNNYRVVDAVRVTPRQTIVYLESVIPDGDVPN